MGGEGEEEKEKNKRLTLEMESLLVHSDSECAVVFIIDSYYSSLEKQKGRGGSERGDVTIPLSCSLYHTPTKEKEEKRRGVSGWSERQERVEKRH